MKINIDAYAGFCPGVRKAIQLAEQQIKAGKKVAALGSLIHNERELERLRQLGLNQIDQDQFEKGKATSGSLNETLLLIRAHGISPQLSEQIKTQNINCLDATCSLVTRSQKLIQQYCEQGFEIVIVGKKDHPEVKALQGYCQDRVLVVFSRGDERKILQKEKVLLIAQTTIEEDRFNYFTKKIMKGVDELVVKNTICPIVKNRQQQVVNFSKQNDVVVFVASRNSSNSKILFELCRKSNPRCHFVSSIAEINREWFSEANSIGLTGGASTPVWQLLEFKKLIEHELNL